MKKLLIACSVLFLIFIGFLVFTFVLFRNNQEVAIAEIQKMERISNPENDQFTAMKEMFVNIKGMVASVVYLLGAILVGIVIYRRKKKG